MTTPATPPPERRIGTRVRDFEIVELVSANERAAVYRASSTTVDPSASSASPGGRFGRGTTPPGSSSGQVALKIYEDGGASFGLVEAAAQGRARHPAVGKLVDAGTLGDGAFVLASEWIDGEPLALRAGKPAPWDTISRTIAAIGAGLGAIHAAGIVHRDLKPSNVMIPRTRMPAAIVIDFSHALIASSPSHPDLAPATDVVLGSALYMSPEQAAGEPLDGRSDLYALGVMMYELLTGAPPFDGATTADIVYRHQHEPLVPPRQRTPDREIPRVADDLCMWLLAKHRDDRIPNARVLAVTLGATRAEPTRRSQPLMGQPLMGQPLMGEIVS